VQAAEETKGRRKRIRSQRDQALRDLRIVGRLKAGVSVNEIAIREKLSPRRVRELIARGLAARERLPIEDYAELQVRRLNEALLVSYGAMAGGNLRAVDRVVKIVHELDRYHGVASIEVAPPQLTRPSLPPLALEQPRPALALGGRAPSGLLPQPAIESAEAETGEDIPDGDLVLTR
jgi:hypothetical protein